MSGSRKNLDLDLETVVELTDEELQGIAGGTQSAVTSGIYSAIASAWRTSTDPISIVESAIESAKLSHTLDE